MDWLLNPFAIGLVTTGLGYLMKNHVPSRYRPVAVSVLASLLALGASLMSGSADAAAAKLGVESAGMSTLFYALIEKTIKNS